MLTVDDLQGNFEKLKKEPIERMKKCRQREAGDNERMMTAIILFQFRLPEFQDLYTGHV